MNRRAFLTGMGATAGLVGCGDVGGPLPWRPAPSLPPLTGELLGHAVGTHGHRLRDGAPPLPRGASDRVDVLVVGGGVAGLSAAWRLRRGGFAGTLRLLDADDALGGTARSGESPVTPYPWGAHYLTMPSREAGYLRALLADLGVITGFDGEGRPRFDARMLCAAPGERLHAGKDPASPWLPGLWNELPVTGEALRQRADFHAACETWRARVGVDGRPAFAIPVAESSLDPEIRALAGRSFAAWLDAHGYTDPVLRAACRYATRDDYGAEPEHVSAWAGLHYFCARRPWHGEGPDLGTDILTWPAGNGWLVARLARAARAEVWTGALARNVVPDAEGVSVDVEVGGVSREVRASHVVLAVPPRVAMRLLAGQAVSPTPGEALRRGREPPPPQESQTSPSFAELAPWRVANLHVSALPRATGIPYAWDSVIADAAGLGYVTATHQRLETRGPSVLTWYMPLSQWKPSAGRQLLADAIWAAEVDLVLSELSGVHPDLRGLLSRVDVLHHGHGTAVPAVGLHADDLAVPRLDGPGGTRVSFAHASLSGVSLFEEAAWHGIRAGEEALAALGILDAAHRLVPVR